MLPRSYRLPRRDFNLVKSQGATYRSPHLTLVSLPQPSPLGHPRVGIITSARFSRSAVIRNRVRRLLYSAFNSSALSRDLIIIPKPGLTQLGHEEINSALNSAVSKIPLP